MATKKPRRIRGRRGHAPPFANMRAIRDADREVRSRKPAPTQIEAPEPVKAVAPVAKEVVAVDPPRAPEVVPPPAPKAKKSSGADSMLAIEDAKVVAVIEARAREMDGTFKGDDPATADVNEAYVQPRAPAVVKKRKPRSWHPGMTKRKLMSFVPEGSDISMKSSKGEILKALKALKV